MDGQLLEPALYTIKGIAILDNDGNRILAKYYDKNLYPTSKEQKVFEKNLFNKTHRANAEIIMLDGLTCMYKSNVDLFFYVLGCTYENEVYARVFHQSIHATRHKYVKIVEKCANSSHILCNHTCGSIAKFMGLILMSVLNCLYESVSHILRKNVEKRAVLDNLDTIMLAFDEICDGGIILDADAASVVQRVSLRTDDIPLGEQTVAQVLQSAKEQLKWSLLK